MKTLVAVGAAIVLVTAVQANENPIINTVENVKDFAVNNEASQFVVKEYTDLVNDSKDSLEQGKNTIGQNKEQIVGIFKNIKGAFEHYFVNKSQ